MQPGTLKSSFAMNVTCPVSHVFPWNPLRLQIEEFDDDTKIALRDDPEYVGSWYEKDKHKPVVW